MYRQISANDSLQASDGVLGCRRLREPISIAVDPAALTPGQIYVVADEDGGARRFPIRLFAVRGSIIGHLDCVINKPLDCVRLYSNGNCIYCI